MRPFLIHALAFTGTLLPAQTILVDVNNGPGTQYTSLVAAAAAAPDGATLLVRPGTYPGLVTIDGKGLAVLAEPGVRIVTGGVLVQNTLPQHRVVLRNLTYQDVVAFLEGLRVSNCAGPVVFENLYAVGLTNFDGITYGLGIGNSAQVLLRDSYVARLSIGSSNVVLEGSTVQGRWARWPGLAGSWSSTPAVELSGATLQVAHSTLEGGGGDCLFQCQPGQVPALPNSPAVNMTGSTLVLRAPSTVVSGFPGHTVAPVTGTGTVRVDPQVVLNNPLAVTPPEQTMSMPAVRSTSAPPGGTITASATGPASNVVLLILGLPGPPLLVPGIADPFWIDATFHLFAAIGVPPQGQPLTAGTPVPNRPGLLGFLVGWQAVSFGPVTGLQASQPSFALVF